MSGSAKILLLIPASILVSGLALGQPGVKVSTVGDNGLVTTTNLTATSGGPGAKAPTPAPDGSAKYWDGLGIGGTSTNYFTQVPYIVQPPNPQIAAGPDDILTIVNRTISRYPNPNASGNTGTLNPYNYPPTEFVPLDVWMGLTILGTQAGGGALCPSGTGSNSSCVIDNASIRYDQLQGRFLVLFTVTDLPAHRSNWVLVVSTFSQFQKCPVPAPTGSVCPTSSPLFTPPVIAPIVGGNQTGGQNPANWVLYKIPVNLLYNPNQQPNALGLINGLLPTTRTPTAAQLLNSAVGTPNTVSSGGSSAPFLTTPFCPNGGPTLPLTYGNGQANGTAGGTGRTCTNYFPTSARFGIDNDNIILTAPVLAMDYAPNEGNFPSTTGQQLGPYAGTRVTTIAKIVVYNGTPLNFSQPGPGGCTSDAPIDCQAVNLSDNVATGTLTAFTQKIAFGFGTPATATSPAGDVTLPTTGPTSCAPGPGAISPSAVLPNAAEVALLNAQNGTTINPNLPVLSCAPLALGTFTNPAPLVDSPGTSTPGSATGLLPAIFWEPDNVRGRALASFDAQVAPFANTTVAGVITPLDYLVGTEITDNLGADFKPAGVSGVTGQVNPNGTVTPLTGGLATVYYVQPIVFSCPGSVIFQGPSGVSFCGSGVPGSHSLVADLAFFGPLRRNVSTLVQTSDPGTVGQGFSPTQLTTSPSNTPVTSTMDNRLFVGDSRPEQVIFREGLLYVARSARVADQQTNALGTSTVLYDIIKTCATAAPAPACGAYSITGSNLSNPALAFEYEWENGINVPDPAGNLNGFGFYQPMFEVPADVVATGPVSPVSTLQLFDKLFVGMTTGGTNNTLATFAKNFPSLWDFRPGDDAYDTNQPYLDPYTGIVSNTYNCSVDITVKVTGVTGTAITVQDVTGLQVGMFLAGGQTIITIVSISGNTVTLSAAFPGSSFPTTATFTRNQPTDSVVATLVTPGSAKITVADATGLKPGQALQPGTAIANYEAFFGDTTFSVDSLSNIGVGTTVTGAQSGAFAANVTTADTMDIDFNDPFALGALVTGNGIPANTTIIGLSFPRFPLATLQLSQNATLGTTSVTFDTTPCFAANTVVTATTPADTSGFFIGGNRVPSITISNPQTCDANFNLVAFSLSPVGFFPATTSIASINGTTVTLTTAAASPLPGLAAGVTSSNVRFNFVTSGTPVAVMCPIIPFSSRGGASTDPNDGSLWLYGEFAKNRLSTIPGPGQWGTSVANYALSFPATDPYNNDNTYFQDVQPTGSTASSFFTWIQIAKNLGIAVPSATGPCTINNGNTPILQPPASGGLPAPAPSSLGCPYFGPDTIVTRAEMAYWVVKSQMDEAQVTNYLCATGGDPSGLSPQCNAGIPASTFADLGAGGGSILNPFLGAAPALGITGVTNAQLTRYIEVMARRGYTKGCNQTNDTTELYCPNQPVTRAQMSVFLIRAKMNNVFPTTLSGIPLSAPYGDNFGTYLPPVPYFSDVTATDPVYGPYYNYIQKMRELRITNGTGGVTFSPGNNLTRKEIATFVVRAFFL